MSVYILTRIYIHTHIYSHTCTYSHAYILTHIHTHMHTYSHTYIYTSPIYTHMHTYSHTYILAHTYSCAYILIDVKVYDYLSALSQSEDVDLENNSSHLSKSSQSLPFRYQQHQLLWSDYIALLGKCFTLKMLPLTTIKCKKNNYIYYKTTSIITT